MKFRLPLLPTLLGILCFLFGNHGALRAEEPTDEVLEALKKIQMIVGDWEGSGRSEKTAGWDEKIQCAWKFNKKGGASLYLTFKDAGKKVKGRLIDEGMFTYDPAKDEYLFRAYKAGTDDLVEFRGKRKTDSNIVLDRVNKKSGDGDDLDRLDVKILSDGDRLVYTFQRRIGRSRVYRQQAQVGLMRQGASLAASGSSGPKCIVTGGAGTMTVTYMGKSYYVCCSGCRATFLEDPEKFIARAGKD